MAKPATRFVKPMDGRDLARLIGLDPEDRRRHGTRRAFERLDADGVIELQGKAGEWRIFAPRSGSGK